MSDHLQMLQLWDLGPHILCLLPMVVILKVRRVVVEQWVGSVEVIHLSSIGQTSEAVLDVIVIRTLIQVLADILDEAKNKKK